MEETCSLQASAAFTSLPHSAQKVALAAACLLHASGGSFVDSGRALLVAPSSIPQRVDYAVLSRTVRGHAVDGKYVSVEGAGSETLRAVVEFAAGLDASRARADPDAVGRRFYELAKEGGWEFGEERCVRGRKWNCKVGGWLVATSAALAPVGFEAKPATLAKPANHDDDLRRLCLVAKVSGCASTHIWLGWAEPPSTRIPNPA